LQWRKTTAIQDRISTTNWTDRIVNIDAAPHIMDLKARDDARGVVKPPLPALTAYQKRLVGFTTEEIEGLLGASVRPGRAFGVAKSAPMSSHATLETGPAAGWHAHLETLAVLCIVPPPRAPRAPPHSTLETCCSLPPPTPSSLPRVMPADGSLCRAF